MFDTTLVENPEIMHRLKEQFAKKMTIFRRTINFDHFKATIKKMSWLKFSRTK